MTHALHDNGMQCEFQYEQEAMRLLVHFGFRGHLLSTAQPTCFRKTQCVMMCVCDAANVVIRWSMLAHCQFAVGLEEPRFNALVNDHYDIIAIVLCAVGLFTMQDLRHL